MAKKSMWRTLSIDLRGGTVGLVSWKEGVSNFLLSLLLSANFFLQSMTCIPLCWVLSC